MHVILSLLHKEYTNELVVLLVLNPHALVCLIELK